MLGTAGNYIIHSNFLKRNEALNAIYISSSCNVSKKFESSLGKCFLYVRFSGYPHLSRCFVYFKQDTYIRVQAYIFEKKICAHQQDTNTCYRLEEKSLWFRPTRSQITSANKQAQSLSHTLSKVHIYFISTRKQSNF